MKQHVLQIALATLMASSLPGALAAPVNYEMSLRTYSGMGAGGAMGMMSAMFGGKGGSFTKQMDLRLTNPADIPGDYAAEHIVPDGMRIGPSLPLKGERRSKGGGDSDTSSEQPEGKVLIYWGCSATVPKGQPEVIDFKAMSSRVPPEVAAMARQSHSRKGGGSAESLPPRTLWWPYGDDAFRGIPAEATAIGDHAVKASFMQQDIRYTLDKEMDFLEPMNLKATSSDLKAAIPLEWDKLARAKGYNLNAAGATGEKEVIIWMAARNKQPMLPGSQNTCIVPAGIFEKTQGAMVMGEAVGPSRGFAYPPQKPGEKKPLIWAAKVRVTAFDNVMLGMENAGKDAAEGAEGAAADSVVPGGGSIIKSLKGLFGK